MRQEICYRQRHQQWGYMYMVVLMMMGDLPAMVMLMMMHMLMQYLYLVVLMMMCDLTAMVLLMMVNCPAPLLS